MTPVQRIGAIMTAATLAAAAPAHGQTSSCRPPDATSAIALADLDTLVSESDSTSTPRRTFFKVERGAPGSVVQLQTDSLCARGAQFVDSVRSTPASGRTVYLYQLGTGYAFMDPNLRGPARGYRLLYMVTSGFSLLGVLEQR